MFVLVILAITAVIIPDTNKSVIMMVDGLAIAPILSRGMNNRPSNSRTSYGSSTNYRNQQNRGNYASGTGSSYYQQPPPSSSSSSASAVVAAAASTAQPFVPFGGLRGQKMSLFYVKPADFDPYNLDLELGGDDDDGNFTIMANNGTNSTLASMIADTISLPGFDNKNITISAGNNNNNSSTADAASVIISVNQSSPATGGPQIIYGNYYKHCAQPKAFSIGPSETYTIYGLSPPAPAGIDYADFIALDVSDDNSNNNMTDMIRVFTDACFFSITHDDIRAGLRVTLKMATNTTSNSNNSNSNNNSSSTDYCDRYQWPAGSYVSLYQGPSISTDWTTVQPLAIINANDPPNCQRTWLIAQPSLAVEIRLGQDPNAISFLLNYTISVEPVPAESLLRTTPSTPASAGVAGASPPTATSGATTTHHQDALLLLLSLTIILLSSLAL